MTLVIIAGLAICLFAAAYLTKRRFGVLGLGLAAGLVLSQELTRYVASFLQYGDFPVEPLKYTTAATIVLILTPVVALLFAGPRYYDKHKAIVSSLLFAVLATVILVGPLARDLPTTDATVEPAMSWLATHTSIIIVVGIIMALLDTLHMHTTKKEPKKAKH